MDLQEIASNETVTFLLSLTGALGTVVMFLVWLLRQVNRLIRWEGIVSMALYSAITGVVWWGTGSEWVTFWVVSMINVIAYIDLREVTRLRATIDHQRNRG